ncbi:histidinol-phosphatase [Pararhodobacter oceanensis]|uniref:Histidinol-phosphatase n=1 Tax=Pararhodobacter oceanensis TaxID=2172121 RepID=A0A2T8HWH6_9RHOB|nr:histidinol-phosphatase [Pararhodobacter oceanensis]PVH29786.1 histidinol-phosphatase [Pararhodobacter oceanensis]
MPQLTPSPKPLTRAEISDPLAAELWQVAQALADAARPEVLAHFRQVDLTADNKDAGGFDPVTVADRAAEAAIRAKLQELRPQDAILGEEQGYSAGSSGLTWVIDPIDGTRAFISGTPTWGVLIGLQDAAGAILGIIDQPYIGERFSGGLGVAQVEGPQGRATLQTHAPRALDQAIIMTTFPEVGSAEEGAAFRRVAARARLTRYGMDCYAYALVASGQVDLVIEAGLNPYDIMAPIAVIEAAGGVVSNWQGGPAHEGGQVIAAANPQIHTEALALLAG